MKFTWLAENSLLDQPARRMAMAGKIIFPVPSRRVSKSARGDMLPYDRRAAFVSTCRGPSAEPGE